MAAARGLPIPPADQVPPELEYRLTSKTSPPRPAEKSSNTLSIPIVHRGGSASASVSPTFPPHEFSLPSPSSLGPSTSPLFRTRAKTLASLTTASRSGSPAEMTPRELQLPIDPFVNGQPIEAYLYKDANECPICFLSYPPYLNTTRCCDQPICSECFVQIKRPEPHQPEHETPDPNAPPVSEGEREAQADGQLVSEVATCPYCKTPEFGITYVPPGFRRGLTYGGASSSTYQITSAMSSQTSISSSGMSAGAGRRRGTSISANAPEVITTDKIRPDWATKLATARAHAARRSAAATALHTAAYLMNGQPDARNFGPFGRRVRRSPFEGMDISSNPHLSALALLAERHAARQQEATGEETRVGSNSFLAPPRGSSSRRTRMDDLEEMMMMEAIRMSLASEEERRKKEEKDAKKEAKKKEKEAKKAEKAGRKNSLFTLHSNTSNAESASSAMERQTSADSSSFLNPDEYAPSTGKGKAVKRPSTPPPIDGPSESAPSSSKAILSQIPGSSDSRQSQESLASSLPLLGSEPFKRSHLRQMSNVSSSASSFVDSGSTHGGAFPGSSTPPGSTSLEPMFNFRSLAAMIGEEESKAAGGAGDSAHVEDVDDSLGRPRSFEEIDDKPGSFPTSPVSPSSASSGLPRDEGEKQSPNVEGANGDANKGAHAHTQNGDVRPAINPVVAASGRASDSS